MYLFSYLMCLIVKSQVTFKDFITISDTFKMEVDAGDNVDETSNYHWDKLPKFMKELGNQEKNSILSLRMNKIQTKKLENLFIIRIGKKFQIFKNGWPKPNKLQKMVLLRIKLSAWHVINLFVRIWVILNSMEKD